MADFRFLRFAIASLAIAFAPSSTLAQPDPSHPESVTVTGTKSREVIGNFTKSFATPTMLTGKIARWERGVCPVAVGQKPSFTRFITQRIKYVAIAVGAPVNTEASCTPNIEVVFTTTPQALLDNVRKNEAVYLGYAISSAQLDALAIVTRPIQAWYTTETVDLIGKRQLDSGRPPESGGVTMASELVMPSSRASGAPTTMANAYRARSTGNRIDGGIHSGFNHIMIVVDTTKVADQTVVLLADYISMLALTQLNSLDVCQQLPSIVNLLAADCSHAVEGLTQFDLAYLQGVYKMGAGKSLALQRNDIADAMTDTLK